MSRGRLLLGLACLLLMFAIAQADTTYVDSITITSPTIWAASGNPYIIRGGVRVQSTLTIEPGVKVYFDASILPRPGILVEDGGQLLATGVSNDSIYFTTTDSTSRCGNIKIEGEAQFSYCVFKRMLSTGIFNGGFGAAIYFINYDGYCLVNHCLFEDNYALLNGGAILIIYQNSVTPIEITNSLFRYNYAEIGGGAIWSETSMKVTGNTFEYNSVGSPQSSWAGGGAINVIYGNVIINNNIFRGNNARDGGALFMQTAGLAQITENLFIYNHARIGGGAIISQSPSLLLNNCTLQGNSSESTGGGFYRDWNGTGQLINCILVGNISAFNNQINDGCEVSYSNIEGGHPGTGNIDIDPQFMNAGAGDFHLACSSLCIDAGDPASPLDLDYTRADMGAYYYHHMNGAGDANYDCQVMGADVTYLVRYFKGLGAAPYPLWRGDASGDTIVAGADVTYLVRYLKGLGNPPVKNPNCSHPDWSIPDSCNPCGY